MTETTTSRGGFGAVERFLAGHGLAHAVVEHASTFTAAAEARVAAVELTHTAKTVMLRDDHGYVMAVIPASETLSLRRVRRVAARPGLRLAAERELAEDFSGFEVGALPPFRELLAEGGFIDFRLLTPHRVLCNGGDHRHSVILDADNLREVCGARAADLCAR